MSSSFFNISSFTIKGKLHGEYFAKFGLCILPNVSFVTLFENGGDWLRQNMVFFV